MSARVRRSRRVSVPLVFAVNPRIPCRRAARALAVALVGLTVGCASQQAKVFRIQPVRPVEELRKEALAAQPPEVTGKRAPDLVELVTLDPTIHLDVRYATTENFLSAPVYPQARAFLQRPAAEALLAVSAELRPVGWGLLVHDAYRPWFVTKVFWEATPADKRDFVADPAKGSKHNRGCAIDLTLYDLRTGKAAEMPSLYDEMSERASAAYAGGTAAQRRRRDLLRSTMERHGFTVYELEWWHFDHRDWEQYPILNVRFEDVKPASGAGAAAATPVPRR